MTKRSINTIKEYRNYLWATDKNGKFFSPNIPEDGFDHALDAIRYALVSLRGKKESNPKAYAEAIEKYNQTTTRQLPGIKASDYRDYQNSLKDYNIA